MPLVLNRTTFFIFALTYVSLAGGSACATVPPAAAPLSHPSAAPITALPAAGAPAQLPPGLVPVPVTDMAPVNNERVRACKEFFVPEFREAAEVAEANPTTDAVVRITHLLDELQPCIEAGAIDTNEHRALLLAARRVFGSWYAHSPGLRATALAGETSAVRIVGGGTIEAVPPARALAEYYLSIERKFEQLAAAAGIPPEALEQELHARSFPYALLEVDAIVGVLMNLLEQNGSDAATEEAIRLLLRRLGSAMAMESLVWTLDFIPVKGMRDAAYEPPEAGGHGIKLENRLYLVSAYTKNLCSVWGDRSNDDLRYGLGTAYRKYLVILFDAERSRPEEAPLDYQWIVPVERKVDESGHYELVSQIPLSRMIEEITFDSLNVRATFEMREAERSWVALLDSRRLSKGGDAEILDAAMMLLRAAGHTDAARSRLGAVSRLLLEPELVDGSEAVAGTSAGGNFASDTAFRQRASRELAELGICLMNKVFLNIPTVSDCTASMDATSPTRTIGPTCAGAPQAAEFLPHGENVPPVTEESRAAYERAIASMSLNWDATGGATRAGAGIISAAVPPGTICDLSFLFHTVALGRLAVGLKTYDAIMSLVSRARIRLAPEQLGPIIAQAIAVATREQRGICGIVGATTCSLSEMSSIADAENDTAKKKVFSAQLARYCDATLIGAGVFEHADQPGPSGNSGISVIRMAAPYLRPMHESELRGRGAGLLSEKTACAAFAAAPRVVGTKVARRLQRGP